MSQSQNCWLIRLKVNAALHNCIVRPIDNSPWANGS